MKIEVKIEKGIIRVGNKKASLLSGAVHYWRLHPNSWRTVLNAIKDMGLETIETYIPWEFHEIENGVYDFSGKTDSRRDLAGFLELVQEMGFWLIVRPGPFIYSEWVHMGVPKDVAKFHRMHPTFTARAADYIQHVSEVIVPFLATSGGNVIMLQAENETDLFEQCYEEQLGLGNTPGPFQAYLNEKYGGDIEKLNKRWDTDFTSFDQPRAIMDLIEVQDEYFNRFEDFVGFRADYITNCVDFYTKEFQKNGFDIPTASNTYNIYHIQNFEDIGKVVDLPGVDAYPANEFADQTSASGEELGHRHLEEVFRYYRTFNETAYIAEYECGVGHGLHYYSNVLWPNHFVMTNLTAIQAGIHAWNWYMLVNRDNWMMSPINEWGRKQGEMFTVFAETVKMYKHMDVPSLEKLTNTSISFFNKYHWLKEALRDPSLQAVYGAGIDYEFFNLNTETFKKPIMFYSGARWLPEEEQKKLLKYVEEGGNLVFFQTLPLYGAEGKKANILGLVRPDRIPQEPFLDHLASETEIDLGGNKILTRAPFFVYDYETPGEPIIGTRVDTNNVMDTDFEENIYLRSLIFGHKYQVGYNEKRGKGSITVVGANPTPELVTAIHHYLGVSIPILSHTQSVKPALFKGQEAYYAVLINTGNQDEYAPINLDLDLLKDGNYTARSLRETEEIKVDDRELANGRIYVHIPRKNGTILEIKKLDN